MSPQAFLAKYENQSLLFNQGDPSLRGQCVQEACVYVHDNGKPVIWSDAYKWWTFGMYPDSYDRIPNTPSAVPQPGDLIVWGPNLPGSGGFGHIAVCLQPLPGTGTFISIDQNWGGKYVHKVTHNYSYVVGWLRIKKLAAPAPSAPQTVAKPVTGGTDEMIANADQAHLAYKLLRPNGDGNPAEINATTGHRTWQQFARDAGAELAARDANLRGQAQHVADMQTQINTQNQTITDLTTKLNDATTSNADKQQTLQDAVAKLADSNAQLTTLHDQITDLQHTAPSPAPAAAPSLVTKFLAAIIRKAP